MPAIAASSGLNKTTPRRSLVRSTEPAAARARCTPSLTPPDSPPRAACPSTARCCRCRRLAAARRNPSARRRTCGIERSTGGPGGTENDQRDQRSDQIKSHERKRHSVLALFPKTSRMLSRLERRENALLLLRWSWAGDDDMCHRTRALSSRTRTGRAGDGDGTLLPFARLCA